MHVTLILPNFGCCVEVWARLQADCNIAIEAIMHALSSHRNIVKNAGLSEINVNFAA